MMKKIIALLMALLLVLPAVSLADAGSLTMVQVYQESGNATRLHVRLEGSADGNDLNLRAEDIAEATIGTGTVPVVSVSSARDAAFGGMRYVFVLDHAMPIGSNRIDQLKDGMHEWIDELNQQDCAAVIVSEKEEVRVVADFTSNKQVLHDAVDDYGKANEQVGKNMIYSGIKKAIDLACETDPELPRNSCIVVCSNGADTYQTLVTAEQLAQLLSENCIPLYVAGFAYNAQKESLVGLMNIARNANGWSEDATPTNEQQTLDEALENLRKRIQGGYDIVLDCSDGFVFNGATLVSIRQKNPDVIVKRTADLYLLKEEKTATPKPAEKPTAAPAGSAAAEDSSESSSSWLDGETVIAGKALKNSMLLPLGIAVIALILLLVIVLSARKRKAAPVSDSEMVAPMMDIEQTTHKDPASGERLAPPTPVMPGSFMAAQGGADGKTTRVRGGQMSGADGKTTRVRGGQTPGAAGAVQQQPQQGQPPVTAAPVAQGMDILNIQTIPSGMVVNGQRQIGSFAPAPAAGIARMIIEYTVDGQTLRFDMPNPMEVTIGRLAGVNTLVIPDQSVSGQHARITCEGTNVSITNISPVKDGYRNRLCVDRKEIQDCAALRCGAHLTIGSVSASIRWEETSVRQVPVASGDATVRVNPGQAVDPNVTQRGTAPLLEVTWTLAGQQSQKQLVRLGAPVTIGRGDKDMVRIQDSAVSRSHMIVSMTPAGLVVENGSVAKETGKNPFYYQGRSVIDRVTYQEGQDILAGCATIQLRVIR